MNLRQLVSCAALVLAAGMASAQDKVVYHVNDTEAQAIGALRDARNHRDTDPGAKITVVAHALGVDFLMEGANDKNGSPYAGPVAALKARGVNFEICEITLKSRNLKKEQFTQEADFTPSGVVRISRLRLPGQAHIRP